MADPIQASASDAPGSAGGAVGPYRAPHPAVAGKGRHRAPDLMVSCKEKRGFGDEVARAMVRITEADPGPNGGAANALATNPAGSGPGSTGGAVGLRHSDAGLV